MSLRHTDERTYKNVLVLLRHQAADIEQDRRRHRQREATTRLLPAAGRRLRIEPMLDQHHRAPVQHRIGFELGSGRRAVGDVDRIEPERAGPAVEAPHRRSDLAGRAGLVNDAQPAAPQPTRHTDQNRSGRLIRHQGIEAAGQDATRHAQNAGHLGGGRKARTRIQIDGLAHDAVRSQIPLDQRGQPLHAAALAIMKNLQDPHRTATFCYSRPLEMMNGRRAHLTIPSDSWRSYF
jgi:hypothetical protein